MEKTNKNQERVKDERKTIKEYIGITGFKTLEEINSLSTVFQQSLNKEYSGMYGFLISNTQLNKPSVESSRNPALKNLKTLINAVPENMMPTLHYCSSLRSLDLDNLTRVLEYDDLYDSCKFLQINLDWPSVNDLGKLKERFPDLYIIQQLNPRHEDTANMLSSIEEYGELVDKLLIDPSLGAGIAYNAKESVEIVNSINKNSENFTYVVCGGLSENTVYSRVKEMQSLLNVNFSIDAEGRLRTQDRMSLDLIKCKRYIQESARALF